LTKIATITTEQAINRANIKRQQHPQ